jgi:3',5'-cyclic-AMP phosphodiesterase
MAILLNFQNRRNFIKTIGFAGLGVLTYSPVIAAENQKARIAFLSDTHVPADKNNVFRGFYPYNSLKQAVALVEASNPQATVISGDLARLEGLQGDYENLATLLNPLSEKMPVALALGNHDNRDNFDKTFTQSDENKQHVKGKHVVVMELGPVRIIVLDSLLYVNRVAGLLGKAQRAWLSSYLDSCDERPTLLVQHHTPGDSDDSLLDFDRLFKIIKNRKKVKALFYGHSHRYQFGQQDGIHLINLPAVGYNFNDGQPIAWVNSVLTKTTGLLTLNTFGGNETKNGDQKELVWR